MSSTDQLPDVPAPQPVAGLVVPPAWTPPPPTPTKLVLWLTGPPGSALFATIAGASAVGLAADGALLVVLAAIGHPVAALTPVFRSLLSGAVPILDVAACLFFFILNWEKMDRRVNKARRAANREARRQARRQLEGRPPGVLAIRQPRRRRSGKSGSRSRFSRRAAASATAAASPFLAFLVVVATTNGLHHLHGIHTTEAAQLFAAAIIELHLIGWGALAYSQLRRNRAKAAIGMPPPEG